MSRSEFGVSTFVIFEKMQKDFRRMMKSILPRYGLSFSALSILTVLKASHPHSLYMREIKDAVQTQLDSSAFDELLSRRMIREEIEKNDEKKRYFSITPKGYGALENLNKDLHSVVADEWSMYQEAPEKMDSRDVLKAGFEKYRYLNPYSAYGAAHRFGSE